MSQRNQTSPRSILLVDDDAGVREPAARWFRDAGWKVNTAESCCNAVSLAAMGAPEYVVAEQRLPDGSAFDLLTRLKAFNPNVVAIVLTRIPSIAAAVHAIRSGFRDYLAKPMDPMRLGALLGVSASVGTALGAVAGYFGGLVDDVISRVIGVLLAFPGLLLAIALVAVLGPSLGNVLFALTIIGWVGYARLVRGQVLKARELEYVQAARALGASTLRVLWRHVIPTALPAVVVQGTARYGVSRMIASLLDLVGVRMEAFLSLPEAETWLDSHEVT